MERKLKGEQWLDRCSPALPGAGGLAAPGRCTHGLRDVRGELALPSPVWRTFSMRSDKWNLGATRKLIGCRKAGQRLCLKPEYSRAGWFPGTRCEGATGPSAWLDRAGRPISQGLGSRARVPRRLQRAAFLFYKRSSLSQTAKKAFKLSLVVTAEVTGVGGYLCYLAQNIRWQVTDLTRH